VKGPVNSGFQERRETATMDAAEAQRHSMKYGIDFKYLARDASVPTDNSYKIDMEVDETQFALVPNIGDHVCIPGDNPGMRNVPLSGRVRSRLFHYRLGYCYITIVVEDSDEDWNKIGGS
jgi:hypothetical protein